MLLKRFKSENGVISCWLKDIKDGTIVEFEGRSSADAEDLEVLRRIIKTSTNEKETKLESLCLLSRVRCPVEGSFDRRYQLCCRLMIKTARHLSDGLPLKKDNVLEVYAFDAAPVDCGPWSPSDFYQNVCVPVKSPGSLEDSRLNLLKKELGCELFPFQRNAVSWLLDREDVPHAGDDTKHQTTATRAEKLPHGFQRSVDVDGKEFLTSRCLNIALKNRKQLEDYLPRLKGGLLCEEMGLGKTVELIALMCLHKQEETWSQASLPQSKDSLQRSRATVIITPPAILRQWQDELQALAPHLKVMVYDGVRKGRKGCSNDELVALIADQDVILTTYNVLAREVYYATPAVPIRNLRRQKKYEQKSSPLTQILWWRVVLDEAQMIESGVSNAAKVAQVLPREHAWAVTGTPVKKDSKDLMGILIFLQYYPYCASVKLWERMIKNHRDVFGEIFRNLALRHTKDQIKDQLTLPPQTRMVINVPFTQIEEQHYSDMYQSMCKDCGLDLSGSPLNRDTDPTSPAVTEKLRGWLARLRQICLHPQVGGRNRKALGASKGPLRTVEEVLNVMTEQNEIASRAEERGMMLSRIRKGQILEHAKHTHDALRIWKNTLEAAKSMVADSRQQLSSEVAKLNTSDVVMNVEDEPESENSAAARTGVYRHRLRYALELEHTCTFFIGNAYYQIKSNPDLTEPDSAAYKELDRLEESTYESAKLLRKELLAEALNKADLWMNRIRAKVADGGAVSVPRIRDVEQQGGIESRELLARLQGLFDLLNLQRAHLKEWRHKLMELVLLPLVDKEDTDLKGDEYEVSTKQQDEVYVYMDALRAIVADRSETLLGHSNTRIDNEMRTAMKQAKEGEGHCPPLMVKLLSTREHSKADGRIGSVRGLIHELRELKTNLRAQLDRGSVRAGSEMTIVHKTLEKLQDLSNGQTKVLQNLETELEVFKDTVDSRLEYYRHLQHISDTVAPYEEDMDDEKLAMTIASIERTESEIQGRVAALRSRARYLIHLRDETSSLETQRQCIICRGGFELGVLTSCGHSYCADCIRTWWKSHRNCPTCKKGLTRNDFHQITFKPQDLTIQEHPHVSAKGVPTPVSGELESIYTGITIETLNDIKNIDIQGSFGTKIDTLVRHLLWIRKNDPGAKSVIFSQFKEFTEVLGRAFDHFRISYATFDKPDGVQKFKSEPDRECFLLHAKAQASGLNLVNATHVFLCEPLINTAIELQAIARVHRIGQHQPTTIWMYLVEDTVEKAIYEISVERRMSHLEHVGAPVHDAVAEQTGLREDQIEAANTLELEQAPLSRLFAKGQNGGEAVSKEDLWRCLFKERLNAGPQLPLELEQDEDSGLHLRVAGAEVGQDQRNPTNAGEDGTMGEGLY